MDQGLRYTTGEVSQILGIAPSRVRTYVRAGLVEPERGPRGNLRFKFQDLVMLRAARGLFEARVSSRRLSRALAHLREQLPRGRGVTGVRITVEGRSIVAGDGAARWQPESGQILFDFEMEELAAKAAPVARRAFREAEQERGDSLSAEEWFGWGCEMEATSPEEAREAYGKAVGLDPRHADAQVNLGRLLHEAGDAAAAERRYRLALEARPDHATAAFNLGVALEDLSRPAEALEAYERAIALDPSNADAHYNAASLCEKLARPTEALAHLKACRELARGSSRRGPRSP